MRGLLEKDYRLLLTNKITFLVFLGLSVYFGISMDGTFALGYFPFVIIMLLVGTISYDEMDHGFQFLMTLPVDAKLYVREKYVLCLSGGLISWLAAAIFYGVSSRIRTGSFPFPEELPLICMVLPIILWFVSLMIPVQLRFGVEKSRLVVFGVCGVAGAVFYILMRTDNIRERIFTALDTLDETGGLSMPLAIGIVTILLCLFSYEISKKIMEKKEL